MTTENFRQLALGIPNAVESSHMDHPDFRIGGKIFASLGYPDDEHGMVKLTPRQQRTFLKEAPTVFAPCAGVWGKRGATSVYLALAELDALRAALLAASKNVIATSHEVEALRKRKDRKKADRRDASNAGSADPQPASLA